MNFRLLALSGLAGAAASSFGFSFASFGPGLWGLPDSNFGIDGYVIDDLESVNLVSGLQVAVTTPNGGYGPTSTLPNLFDPAADAFGTAFVAGVWDGSHGIVNTRTNQTFPYSEANSYGDLELNFTDGAETVGLSVENDELDSTIFVNGINMGLLSAAGPNLVMGGGRQGYIRIDAGVSEVIHQVRFVQAPGDGIMLDHIAFEPVPEPASLAVLGLGALALVRRRRAKR